MLLTLQRDSAPYNLRADRILFRHWETKVEDAWEASEEGQGAPGGASAASSSAASSSASTGRAHRVLEELFGDGAVQEEGAGPPIVLVSCQRCEAHVGGVMLKLQLKLSQLLAPLFAFAHLLRIEDNKDAMLMAGRLVFESRVDLVEGDPPACCQEFLKGLFERTLLQGSTRGGGRAKERQEYIERAWGMCDEYAAAFK